MWKASAILLLGALPAAYALVSSRKVYRWLDDPLLPDLLSAYSRDVGTVAGIVIGIASTRPARRPDRVRPARLRLRRRRQVCSAEKIFDESWSLVAYLSHKLRFWLGNVGSLLLIASIPSAMAVAGERSLLVGAVAGAAALLWALFGSSLFRRLVGARPLDSVDLPRGFARVVSGAKCQAPALFEAEASGGSWINAFALPSLRGSAVLFTRGLLDALTPSETTAIFAHELAHLEHFTRRKLGLGLAVTALLAMAPLAIWGGPYARWTAQFRSLWPLALLFALMVRARQHRAHEAESDRRAVELCGDPEALVSALTKLHALTRVARRWSDVQERRSSHPSLARRIQAIRAASPSPDPASSPDSSAPVEGLFLAADSSGTAVLLDETKLHWLRGVPADGS